MDVSNIILGIIIAILLLISVVCFIKLSQSNRNDKQRLENLKQALLSYISGKDYETLKTNLNDDPTLNALWQDFDKSLIKTQNSTIYSTVDSAYFFNSNTLIGKLNDKLYLSIPSILLAIGLIGTFASLAWALWHIDVSNATSLKDSMPTLIRASGAKFASSLAGLLLSVGFTYYLSSTQDKLNDKIKQIQELINSSFNPKSSEQSLFDIGTSLTKANEHNTHLLKIQTANYQELQKHTGSLGVLNEALSSTITPSLDTLKSETILSREELENQTQVLNGLSENIAEKIGGKITGSLEPLAKLDEVVAKLIILTNNIGGNTERTLFDTLDSFSEKLGKDFAEQIKIALVEAMGDFKTQAGTDTSSIGDKIGELKNTLEGLKGIFETQQSTTESVTGDIQDKLAKALEDMNLTIGALNLSLTGTLGKANQVAQDLENSTNEKIANVESEATTAIRTIGSQLEKIKTLIDDSTLQLANVPTYLGQFTTATSNLSDSANQTLKSVTTLNTSSNTLQTTSNQLSSSTTQLNQAMREFTDNLSEQQKKLQQLPPQLQAVVDKTKIISTDSEGVYKGLASNHQKMLEDNQQAIKAMQSQVDTYRKAVQQSMVEYQKIADDNIKNTLTNFDKELSEFAKSLAGAVGELNDSIGLLASRKR